MRSLHFRLAAAGVVLAVCGIALAQEEKVGTEKSLLRRLTVVVGGTVRVQMTTKRPIRLVVNENDSIVRVLPVPNDPSTILVTGLRPGITRIHLTDVDGRKEILGPGKK